MPSAFYSFLHSFFYRFWWVIAFVVCCFFFYEQSLKNRHELHSQLIKQHEFWTKEKKIALKRQYHLETQINSQNDLAWIELVLMKRLGLVPENQQKIYFEPSKLSKSCNDSNDS